MLFLVTGLLCSSVSCKKNDLVNPVSIHQVEFVNNSGFSPIIITYYKTGYDLKVVSERFVFSSKDTIVDNKSLHLRYVYDSIMVDYSGAFEKMYYPDKCTGIVGDLYNEDLFELLESKSNYKKYRFTFAPITESGE